MMSDFSTQISQFVEGDGEVTKELELDEDIIDKLEDLLRGHNLHELDGAKKDKNFLEHFVSEFQKIKREINENHKEFSELLLRFRRGQHIQKEHIEEIEHRAERLKQRIEAAEA